MGRAKAKAEEPLLDDWAEYRSVQLTSEESAELRRKSEALADEARQNRVYEQFLALVGTVHLDMDDLRRAREDDD